MNETKSLDKARTLVNEIEKQRDNFLLCWTDVLAEMKKSSECLNRNEIILNQFFNDMKQPFCPRSHLKELDTINKEQAAKILWKELYVEGFGTIISNLNDKLTTEQY